jgi:hypothetical protein
VLVTLLHFEDTRSTMDILPLSPSSELADEKIMLVGCAWGHLWSRQLRLIVGLTIITLYCTKVIVFAAAVGFRCYASRLFPLVAD